MISHISYNFGFFFLVTTQFLPTYFLESSIEVHDTNRLVQTIFLDDLLINGRHHRIEDIVTSAYDGSLFIQRVLKLTDINPFAVASMALEIPPEKKNATKLDTSLLPLNHSKILIPYIQAMAAAPFALEAVQMEKNGKAWNILEIGLGTGILNSFLHDVFSSMNITTIELEEGMYEIAKKYFGLVEDNYNKIIVGDGLLYLQKTAGQSKFDVIFIDACYNTVVEVMCPVEAFLMKENLKIIKEALTKNGIVVISVLTFEDDKLSEIQKNYTNKFGSCHRITDSVNLVNHVLACGEFRRNKSRFAKKLKEIYEKFEFYSEPNIE